MTRFFKTTSLLLLGAALAWPQAASARSLLGTITEVKAADHYVFRHDAGTYDVVLFGVDAPEANQPFAVEARRLVEGMVQGKMLRIWIDGRNSQDQMEARVIVDGEDVGLALMKAGYAARIPDHHYKLHSKSEPDALVMAENEARLARRGLWKNPSGDTKEGVVPMISEAVRVAGTLDINASKKSGDDNECAMAQDPSNPLRLYMSCNTSSAGLFAARSLDGGVTWSYPDPTDKTVADGDTNQGTSACCDPTLAFDRFGNLYLTYINSGLNAIITLLSTDGGVNFSQIGSFTGSIDQPTVVAASVGANANVWVIWNQTSMLARGLQATGLGTVGAFTASQTAPTTSGCSFGDIAISPAGVVVQACENPTGGQGPNASIRFNADTDGLGAGNFGASSVATTTNVGGFDFIPAQNARSVDAEVGLAYDANSASPHFGRLYMVYTEEPVNENHDMDIMVRFSDNDGTSWSSPIKVNDDATTKSQFLPKIATDPATGNIGVCWHDARNSGSNTAMELYCATATTAGATPTFSANVKLGDGPSTSNGNGVEFGDYMGLAFAGGQVHPVWGDTSNSTGDNPGGTGAFDAYTDFISLDVVLFADGFETGNTSAWSLTSP